MKEDPAELPEATPAGLRQVITHCLEKEPVRRFQTARDVAFALRTFSTRTGVQGIIPAAPSRSSRTMVLASAISAKLLLVGGFGVGRARTATPLDLSH
jgi:hypothetical protein